jgi:hypothetical protein
MKVGAASRAPAPSGAGTPSPGNGWAPPRTDSFALHGREPGHVHDPDRIRTTVDALRTGREVGAVGLETLRRIVVDLSASWLGASHVKKGV